MKRKRYIIGGIVVCLALGYLIYVLLGSTMPYYSTVSDLKASGASVYGQRVRINGDVVPGSIESNTDEPVLTFTISDGQKNLEVVYEGDLGDVPDAFGGQTQVVLEGKLNSAEIFHASTILTQCPSKYEPE